MGVWEQIKVVEVHPATLSTGTDWVRVVWSRDGAEAVARLEYLEERARLVDITIRAAQGEAIWSPWRRAPTDAVLLRLLLARKDGRDALTWLRMRAEDPNPSETELDREIQRTSDSRPRRARRATNSQLRAEVTWVREQLGQGLTASEITSAYQDKFYRSEATAYRRLKEAREPGHEHSEVV